MVPSLLDYIMKARPAVSDMLGLTPTPPTPQQRVNQGFSAFPPQQGAGGPDPTQGGGQMDFNQSFGAAPFNTPQDRQAFLSKYMQGGQPAPAAPAPSAGAGAPMDLSPPNPGPSAPQAPPGGGFSNDFMGRWAQMGAQPNAGLLSKFVNLAGFGRPNADGGGPSGNLGGFY